jgi:peptidoglycan/LPS O-acetylase OafA/YrhL
VAVGSGSSFTVGPISDMKNSGSADSHVIRYRADVDGLRAIAVISVVLFHLFQSAIPGGYLGVDMFFVLSGYLITSIVWREVQQGRFSIARFYDRRIRRIMPALLTVLVVTTAIAILLLLPADLVGYGKSLLATLSFVANIYFWRDTNYFAAAAEFKPLLHLWSLGVEEQFYILFPLMLLLLARWWPRAALPAIAALTAGSLGLNMLAIMHDAGSPAFFLLPTRAWELGLGACLALHSPGIAPRSTTAGVLAVVGALLVVGGILYPPTIFWIVPVAVPTVAGTALLIFSGQHNVPTINRWLQLRPIVFVGLISYSLYLWHWPIIVFARYYLVHDLRPLEIAAALVIMTACAIASWYVVERPFRDKAMPIRAVRFVAAAGTVLLAIVAPLLIRSQGFPHRLSAQAAVINEAVGTNYRCPVADYIVLNGLRACAMNLPSRNPADADVVLLGNSHAQMYAPLWASILSDRAQTGLLIPVNGCLPTVQANISRACIDIARQNLTTILGLPRARTVILGLTWWNDALGLVDRNGRGLDDRDNGALIAALDDLIDQLRGAGKQVVLIGPLAQPGRDIASEMSRELAFGHPVDGPAFMPAPEFERRFGSAIRHFETRGDISFARPDRVQCHAERCEFLLDGHSLFADDNHLAVAELQRFRTVFANAVAVGQ